MRALVLDGAVDPTQDQIDSTVAQGAGFQKAFDDFLAWCAKRDDCALGKDENAAQDNFEDLIRPLDERPVDVDGRPLTYDDATTGVIQALYSQQLWENLNTGLNELRQQQGRTLMFLADLYLERGQDGKYTTTQDAFTAIHCVDDPRITDPNSDQGPEHAVQGGGPVPRRRQPAQHGPRRVRVLAGARDEQAPRAERQRPAPGPGHLDDQRPGHARTRRA